MVAVNGTLNIGASLDFNDFSFTQLSAFAPGPQEFILFQDNNAITGNFGTVAGSINCIPATIELDGNNVVLQVVPEPGMRFPCSRAASAWRSACSASAAAAPRKRHATFSSVGTGPVSAMKPARAFSMPVK